MPASQELIDSVANENNKVGAGTPAYTAGLVMQDYAAHRNRVAILAEAGLFAAMKNLYELDPSQAVSQIKTLTGDDLGQKLSNLAGALAQIQQAAKIGQTTPPETGKIG